MIAQGGRLGDRSDPRQSSAARSRGQDRERNCVRPSERRYPPQDPQERAAPGGIGGDGMIEYTVIYEWGKRNWSAYVPDLPGCIATGKTRKQVEKLIREAVEFHIEGMQARGEKVPEPTIEAGTV